MACLFRSVALIVVVCCGRTVKNAINLDQQEERAQMEILTAEKKLGFDPDKAAALLEELIEVFQRHKPTVGEIVTVSSNLIYTLGASIGSFGEKGPGIEELKRLYYSERGRMDVALMLQGLTMATWYIDWEQQVIADNIDKTSDTSIDV